MFGCLRRHQIWRLPMILSSPTARVPPISARVLLAPRQMQLELGLTTRSMRTISLILFALMAMALAIPFTRSLSTELLVSSPVLQTTTTLPPLWMSRDSRSRLTHNQGSLWTFRLALRRRRRSPIAPSRSGTSRSAALRNSTSTAPALRVQRLSSLFPLSMIPSYSTLLRLSTGPGLPATRYQAP